MTTPAFEAKELSISYGQFTVLRVPSLRLMPGSTVWLKGDNGSGKSSLLHGIAGIGPKVSARSLKVFGTNIAALSSAQRSMSGIRLVPQQRLAFSRLSVRDHFALAQRLSKQVPSIPECLQAEAIGEVLSGGEVRILLTATLGTRDTRVLMLDEPFAGLDDENTRNLIDTLRSFASPENCILATDHTGAIERAFPDCHNLHIKDGHIDFDKVESAGD